MMQKFAFLAAIALTFAATDSEATTLVVNLTNPTETTYKSGNEWFLKTQGITFSGVGPVSIGGGGVLAYDSAIYDEGTGTFTLEDLPFAAKSITFDLTRIHTSTFCNPFMPQTCIDANKISATAYDALGNLLGSYTTTDAFTSIRFASELGIGRVVWTGSTANDGRVYPPFFGNGSRLSNLVLSDAVPEPATWSMMITGFGLIGGMTRYRRRNVKVAYS